MKNVFIFVLCLCVIGLGVLAWRQSVELAAVALVRANDEGPLGTRARLEQAQKEIERLHGLLAKSSPLPASTVSSAGAATADPATAAVDAGPASPVNPILRERMLARIDRQFATLWKKLGFTPDQIQRYDSLLLEHRLSLMDFNRVAVEQGVGAASDPQGYAQAVSEFQDAAQTELANALGPAAFAQYQQYAQTLRQRGIVDGSLQPYLTQAAQPLTEGQADQLVQILAQNPAHGTSLVSTSAITAAASVLTPEQFLTLQRFRELEQTQQNLARQLGQVQRQLNPP